jgi:hypothetical protein
MEQVNIASLPDSFVNGQKPMYIETTPDPLCNVNLSQLGYNEILSPPPAIIPNKELPDQANLVEAETPDPYMAPTSTREESLDEQEFLSSKLEMMPSIAHKTAFTASRAKTGPHKALVTPQPHK